MTDLQFSLAITGGIVVLLMFLYNNWQSRVKEKKARLDQQRRLQTDDIPLVNTNDYLDNNLNSEKEIVANDLSISANTRNVSQTITLNKENDVSVTSFSVKIKDIKTTRQQPIAIKDEVSDKINVADTISNKEELVSILSQEVANKSNNDKKLISESFDQVIEILTNSEEIKNNQILSNKNFELESSEQSATLPTNNQQVNWPPNRKFSSTNNKAPVVKLHQAIDYIVDLEFVTPILVEEVFKFCLDSQYRFEKPVLMTGWNELSLNWEWCTLGSSDKYAHLQLGMQIVNRQGPVASEELKDFITLANSLADNFKCKISAPSLAQYLEQAKKLDSFCAQLDKQIAISVQSEKGQEFPGTKVRGMAEAAGMVLSNGSFARFSGDESRIIFVVHPQPKQVLNPEILRMANFSGLTFIMDVTHIQAGLEEFEQMLRIINSFSSSLKGKICDDNGKILSNETLSNIRDTYLLQTQSKLQQTAITPGSSLALRLFS